MGFGILVLDSEGSGFRDFEILGFMGCFLVLGCWSFGFSRAEPRFLLKGFRAVPRRHGRSCKREFPKIRIRGTLFWGPHNKDPTS